MNEIKDFELALVRRRLAKAGLQEGKDYVVKDWKSMRDSEMLQALGQDARLWAEAFCQHFPAASAHEDNLVTWFANAIESTRKTNEP